MGYDIGRLRHRLETCWHNFAACKRYRRYWPYHHDRATTRHPLSVRRYEQSHRFLHHCALNRIDPQAQRRKTHLPTQQLHKATRALYSLIPSVIRRWSSASRPLDTLTQSIIHALPWRLHLRRRPEPLRF